MVTVSLAIHRLVERPPGRLLRKGLSRGMEEIRLGTPPREAAPLIPSQPTAPEAERLPAAR